MDMPVTMYFRREDYVPLWRRVLIDVVDFVVVAVLWFVQAGVLAIAWAPLSLDGLLLLLALILFAYLVLLKGSRIGTLGYRLAGARIVGPDGQIPGLRSLALRLVFVALGPLNIVVDLAALSADPHRQALRDKFAGTYVINRNAKPAGVGTLVWPYYEICGYHFLFREIREGVSLQKQQVDA
jgi:uncharacterized RDD family membrane protein YckC